MPSTAISAQGTLLSIGTGTGGAKTISGVTVGNPTLITATAHGFNNGDVVTIAALTGADAALLNGQNWTVLFKTTNAFSVGIDTTGKTITPGAGTATPITFTSIPNIKQFTGLDGSASEIDVSNLASTAKEIRLGLVDGGQFSFDIDYDNTLAAHAAIRAKQISGLITNFQLTLPNTNVVTFTAFVKKFSMAGGVDQVIKTNVNLRVSGPITGL